MADSSVGSSEIVDDSVADADLATKNFIKQTGAQIYAASSQGNDTYVITLTPTPASLTAGMVVVFKADVANTGAATLNVNSLGAAAIVRPNGDALSDSDIRAGQVAIVVYDGTNWQLQTNIVASAGFLATASDNLKASADTQRSTTGSGYVKKKQMTVALSGVFRVKFDLSQDQISTAYAKIYRNGVAWGTEQTQTGTNVWGTKSEDLHFMQGDTIELWLNCAGGGYNTICRNFRVYYDKNTASDIVVDTD